MSQHAVRFTPDVDVCVVLRRPLGAATMGLFAWAKIWLWLIATLVGGGFAGLAYWYVASPSWPDAALPPSRV